MMTYASSRSGEKKFTAADVYECVGISKTYNVFELEKAVAGRNLRLSSGISLMIMDREGQKEGLSNIVRYLTTFFIRVWKLSQPEVRAMSQSDMAKILGMYGKQEYFVKTIWPTPVHFHPHKPAGRFWHSKRQMPHSKVFSPTATKNSSSSASCSSSFVEPRSHHFRTVPSPPPQLYA